MTFEMIHGNRNVFDLEKSVRFYKEALGFEEALRYHDPDGKFILVFMKGANVPFQLELTWLVDRKEPYNLGDNEIHLAVKADDYDAALKFHRDMGCVCLEPQGKYYFISDPDGYWIEILP